MAGGSITSLIPTNGWLLAIGFLIIGSQLLMRNSDGGAEDDQVDS